MTSRCKWPLKVARHSTFVGAPSIFESLRLKKIYLHCKTIITVTSITHTHFLGDRNSNNATIDLALNRIAAIIGIFFRNAWRYLYFGCLLSVVRSFIKNLWEEFQDVLEFLQKGYNSCMNWRLDLLQTTLLVSGCFRKVSITHSFHKWPLYALQPAKRK